MSVQASPLLATKLNRPSVTGDRIDRPRLIDQLNHSLQQGSLTLVCASAGFGKTTLVSSWIESLTTSQHPPVPAAWLSLDEGDSDLVLFLRYFVAAIRTAFPESCADTLALLQTSQPVSQAPLLIALSNDMERLPARGVLVLDDYYTLAGNAVHDFLSELLRHWPQHLHLVLVSRSNPPLPLANLRARGQVAEIRTRDLRFRPDETAEFLNRAAAVPLSPSAIDLLHERLEGWIAGLRLVTLSLRSGANANSDLAALSGTHFEIADYLVDDVMAHLTPAILTFLLATSILDRFCAELCRHVLGSAAERGDPPCDVSACIRWLERNNLFVIPLDDDRHWYRYHHLFQELLQRRLLNEAGPEQVADLHRRAAAWFKGQGLIDEALHHALAIDDLDLAAELMIAGLCDVLNREDRVTLDRWLRLLPDEFIQRQPWLLTIKVVAVGFSWQLAASYKVLDQIDALLDKGEDPAPRPGAAAMRWIGAQDLSVPRGIVATLRGQQAFANGQGERAVAYAEDVLAFFPNRWRYVRGVAVQYWGMAMQATGRGNDARRRLIDDYAGLLEKSDPYALRLLFATCFNAIESGDLEQAQQYGQVMLDQATAGRLPQTVGFSHYFLGVVHYCRNKLDAAEQHFGELAAQRLSVHTQAARNGMIGLTRVHVATADICAAWPVMELLSQFDLDRLGQDGEDARSVRAQLEYVQGDTEPAFRWADGFTAPVAVRSLLWLQNPHLAKAQLLLERGTDADVQAALDILDVLLEGAERTFSVRFQIEVLALRALALDRQGKVADGLAALQKAVELARPGGFVRVFVDLGSPMRTLLLRLVGQGRLVEQGRLVGRSFAAETIRSDSTRTDHIRRIVAAFPEPSPRSETGHSESGLRAANARLVEPLTDRELQVLALLREHLTNKEIAKSLCLSTMTVKRHTVNLYGKLGVNSRRDAVAKAEALKILPPS